MKSFETPIDFGLYIKNDSYEISYSQVMEIAQGGPIVGFISINQTSISKYRFGGPILFGEDYIYAPLFIRKFCVAGFKIARINIQTLNVEIIGKIRNLIFLDHIDNDCIYFYTDLNKTDLKFLKIDSV